MVVFAQRGLWGAVYRRWPVDLFPVRRRLCLETVCFPEETPSPPHPYGIRRYAGSGVAHVSSGTCVAGSRPGRPVTSDGRTSGTGELAGLFGRPPPTLPGTRQPLTSSSA